MNHIRLLIAVPLVCLSALGQARESLSAANPDTPNAFLKSAEVFAGAPADSVVVQAAAEEAEQEQKLPFMGYLSFRAVYERMPEYAQAQADFANLKAKYDEEAARSEQEFQRKFAEFLQGQKDFPPSILRKRQLELQDLMEQSIAFREQSRKLLAEAERQMQQVVSEKLNAAIRTVASNKGLLFVINTDGNTLPYVHPDACMDVTAEVLKLLKLE